MPGHLPLPGTRGLAVADAPRRSVVRGRARCLGRSPTQAGSARLQRVIRTARMIASRRRRGDGPAGRLEGDIAGGPPAPDHERPMHPCEIA